MKPCPIESAIEAARLALELMGSASSIGETLRWLERAERHLAHARRLITLANRHPDAWRRAAQTLPK